MPSYLSFIFNIQHLTFNIQVVPSTLSLDILLYFVPIYNMNATFVLQFNTTDGSNSEIENILLSFEFASYAVDSNGDIYDVGGYNVKNQIVKVNLDPNR